MSADDVRALLEALAVRLATTQESIDDYIQKSLLRLSSTADDIQSYIDSSLKSLNRMGLITLDEHAGYSATRLGKAVVASALDPEDGVFIHKELKRALQAFALDGELHILYTFTPIQDFAAPVNWQVFRAQVECLDQSGLRVMTFLGLKPTTINKMFVLSRVLGCHHTDDG